MDLASHDDLESALEAERIVGQLLSVDVRPGDVVGLYLPRSPELIASMLGTL